MEFLILVGFLFGIAGFIVALVALGKIGSQKSQIEGLQRETAVLQSALLGRSPEMVTHPHEGGPNVPKA